MDPVMIWLVYVSLSAVLGARYGWASLSNLCHDGGRTQVLLDSAPQKAPHPPPPSTDTTTHA